MKHQAQNSMKKDPMTLIELYLSLTTFSLSFRSFLTTDGEVLTLTAIRAEFSTRLPRFNLLCSAAIVIFPNFRPDHSTTVLKNLLRAPCGLELSLSSEAWYLMLFTIWPWTNFPGPPLAPLSSASALWALALLSLHRNLCVF